MAAPPSPPRSRAILTLVALALLASAAIYAFWPRAMEVDSGRVTRGPIEITVVEEARTRVGEVFVVSTPAGGRISRIAVEPGDLVVAGKTLLFELSAADLDPRAYEQARAGLTAAEAGVRRAGSERDAAEAALEQAIREEARTRSLGSRGLVSTAAMERAEEALRSARARAEASLAQNEAAKAEREAARALTRAMGDIRSGYPRAEVHSPVSGTVLRVRQESETVLPAGAPVLEIGDVAGDLEVLAELLSRDAVAVRKGMKVRLEGWGGAGALTGEIERVEPGGFTKFSALGVEEQRVNVIIRLLSPPEEREGLGEGYRLEAHIITRLSADALKLPSAALFRTGDDWMVMTVRAGRARQKPVEVLANNGVDAEVRGNVVENEIVILHPPAALSEGQRVRARQAPADR